MFADLKKMPTFVLPKRKYLQFGYQGVVAQVVEQWTENPCVAGSTPADTTSSPLGFFRGDFFVCGPFQSSNLQMKLALC